MSYLYFLFEHKSYVSKNIALQLLRYMVEIWEAKANKENQRELPMIIPLVIYHGSKEWKVKTTLGSMIQGFDEIPTAVKKYVPNYEYLLYDLSKYSDEEIKGEVQLRILLTIFRDIFTKDRQVIRDSILWAAEHLKELEDRQSGIEYFETFVRYILNAGQKLAKDDIELIIERIETTFSEGSETIMTLAEQFREEGREAGLKEGIEAGLKEGIEAGREAGEYSALAKTVIRLLTKKFGVIPASYHNKIKKVDSITLELIIDEIFEYKSLEELDRYLK